YQRQGGEGIPPRRSIREAAALNGRLGNMVFPVGTDRRHGHIDCGGAAMKRNRLADHALELARKGDWGALSDYLERGWPRTPEICEFLVDVFLGRITRPKRKPKKTATLLKRNLEIGGFVEELKRQGVRNPILQAQKLFRASRSTVQAAKR